MTEFKMRSKGEGAYEILVDGEDIALKVKHVEFEFPRYSPPLVKLTLMASEFELDLPDAEITEQRKGNTDA